MRRPLPMLLCFGFVTIAFVAVSAAATRTGVGTQVHANRGDLVLFLVPRQTSTCHLGDVATGRVVGVSRDLVGMAKETVVVRGRRVPELLVDKTFTWSIPARGAQAVAPVRVAPGRLFILGTGSSAACDSRALGTVSRSALLGYTQAGMANRVAIVQRQLSDRITAEKYVVGAYLLFAAFFALYLVIHASRFVRLRKELARLGAEIAESAPSPGNG